MLTFDRGYRVTGWSSSAEVLFGWTAAEAIGRVGWELLPADGNRFERMRALERGGWSGVAVVPRKDGTLVAVKSDITAIWAHGQIVGWEAKIRELDEPDSYRTQLWVNAGRRGVMAVDPHGSLIVGWDANAERLSGWPFAELAGRHVSYVFEGGGRRRRRKQLHDTGFWTGPLKLRTKDGDSIDVVVWVAALRTSRVTNAVLITPVD